MPMSLFQVYGHFIFSTKNRVCWLDDSIRERVHGYLAATARDLGVPFVVAGGPDDHILMSVSWIRISVGRLSITGRSVFRTSFGHF